jgi:predicted DNA-binding transcriptional regulator AlpA
MKLLRYPDLVAMGVVNSRPTLARMIATQGFPPGRLISPNARAWEEGEVTAWIASRPTARKVVPPRLPPRPAQKITGKDKHDAHKKTAGDRRV